ncbi:LexA family protein [Chitinimonas sp.]|uniref:LexA family protein n=1 Tax=Chitinimonas sp. TaxID=1934313 RepID=UPI002F92EFFD
METYTVPARTRVHSAWQAAAHMPLPQTLGRVCRVALPTVPVQLGLFDLPAEPAPKAAHGDEVDLSILQDMLIDNPEAAFVLFVKSGCLPELQVSANDMLLIDRALQPLDACNVLVSLDGEMMVRRLRLIDEQVQLLPLEEDGPQLEPGAQDWKIWGVVTSVIRRPLRGFD